MPQRCGMLGIPRSEQDQIGKGPARPYLPGRLLEGAGNRASRGMTIDALSALQNPAYRPALVGKTPPRYSRRRLSFTACFLAQFQFETQCFSTVQACRFAEKTRFLRSLWAGRRRAAASRFIFFKGKMFYCPSQSRESAQPSSSTAISVLASLACRRNK